MNLAENLLSIQVKLKRDPYYASSKFKYTQVKKAHELNLAIKLYSGK